MLVVVGGHSRNIGKTSVVCELVAALRDWQWQAVKITQHGHNVCATDGHECGCDSGDPDHPFALDEQVVVDATDSGRYLAAGAVRSWWLRTAQGELGYGLPSLRTVLAGSKHTIVESNSLMGFVLPDFYVVVLDHSVGDMKNSSRLYMDRADAFVVNARGMERGPWRGVPDRWIEGKPSFAVEEGRYVPDGLVRLVKERLLVAVGNPALG
ncbi:MAG TPA: hypothetical protein VM120_08880 [Bryobacteraceae bacterium]|nr:hypothetical protein [Bryobacteraceae bacterium]